LEYTQDAEGLKVTLPTERPAGGTNFYTLKISGLDLHRPPAPAKTAGN
jgi:hypothetical protein